MVMQRVFRTHYTYDTAMLTFHGPGFIFEIEASFFLSLPFGESVFDCCGFQEGGSEL